MTDFFLLATAVFAAVVLVRILTQHWSRTSDETEEVDIGR
tara:strand:+ start:1164 stop:1283 length:120 start_codon:yes stop_codon:yes gene_type:complete